MKKYFNLDFKFQEIIKIFLITFAICSGALLLSSLVPDKRIDNNIEKSITKMNKEKEYFSIIEENSHYFQVDNWSEAALLNFIYTCDASDPLKCTFAETNYAADDKSGLENANLMIKETSPNSNYKGEKIGHYAIRSSYWLGSRTFVRPLLFFIDYYQIRYLLISIVCFMSIFTAIKLGEKTNWKYALAFVLALVFTKYFIGLFAISNAFVYLLTFVSMDYILLTKKKTNYFSFMFLIGMLTSYFDWFTIPLITWGFTVITILLKEYHQEEKITFDKLFNILFKTGLAWCLGYASMLLFRVLFSYMVAGKAALEYFSGRVTTNTGMKDTSIIVNVYNAVKYCLNGVLPITFKSKKAFLLIVGFFGLTSVGMTTYLTIRKKHMGVPLILTILSPFAWIIAFNEFHSIHWWFAYRSLGIFIFAYLLIVVITIEEIIKQVKDNDKVKGLIKKVTDANVVRFLIVGGTSTIIDYLIYMVISTKLNLLLSKCISMLIACIFSFIANKNWTFRNKDKENYKMVLKFVGAQIINIGVNTGINYLMYNLTHSKTIAFVIATFIAMIINYLLQRFVVFKGDKK